MAYFENIKTFVRVYDLGSMSAAGRDLRVSAAVASSRIAELEKHLGARLFNRTTRALSPTEHGRVFYKGAIKVLDTIKEVEGEIAELTTNPKGTIFVAAPLGLGKLLIAPLVLEFKAKYPQLHINLRLSNRHVDLTAEGLDAAFILGNLEDSEMRAKPIYEFERILCASPKYIAEHGMPSNGDDIVNDKHNCLLLRFPGVSEFHWQLNVDGEPKPFRTHASLESDDGNVLLGWARSGAGIVNTQRFSVEPYLKSGELVEVAAQTPPTNLPFNCIYPHKRLQDMKFRLFIDYMISRCRKILTDNEKGIQSIACATGRKSMG